MKPGTYDGSASLDTFLVQFRTCARHNDWSNQDRRDFLMNSLRGEPAQLIWDSGSPEDLTYDQLEERLRARFGSTGMTEKFRAELQALRQQRDETLSHLHSQVCRLMALAYPGTTDSSLRAVIARDYFLAALKDRQLALKIREREPADLDAAYRLAVRQEAYAVTATDSQTSGADTGQRSRRNDDLMERRISQVEKTLKNQTLTAPEPNGKVMHHNDAQLSDMWHQEIDQLRKDLQLQRSDLNEARKDRDRCHNEAEKSKAEALKSRTDMERELSRFRHLEQQLHETRSKTQLSAQVPSRQSSTIETVGKSETAREDNTTSTRRPLHTRCYNCDQDGHFSRNCPEKRKQRSFDGGDKGNRHDDDKPCKGVRGTSADDGDEENSTAYIRLRINGFPVNCLLDTGAPINLLVAAEPIIGVRRRTSAHVFRKSLCACVRTRRRCACRSAGKLPCQQCACGGE